MTDAKIDVDWPRMGGELGELSRVFQHVIQQRQGSHRDAQLLLTKMRAIMAKAPVGIALTRHRRFELVSAEYEEAGLEGEAPRLIYASDEFYQALGTRVAAAFAATQFSEEVEFLRRDCTRFWGQLQGAPVSADDVAAGTIWTLEDVSATRRERNALSYAATHDALTGLANRQHFEASMAQQLASNGESPAALLFIDLDGFKAVNDGASHAAGDRPLKDVADQLHACPRGRRRRGHPASDRGPRALVEGRSAARRREHRGRRDRSRLRGPGRRRRGRRCRLLRGEALGKERRPRARRDA